MKLPNPGTKHAGALSTGLAALLALSVPQATLAGTPMDCDAAAQGADTQLRLTAAELLEHGYDTDRLSCGVSILTAIADRHPDNYADQLAALQANARNIYFLDRIVLYELGYLIAWYVTEVPEETKTNASMIALFTAQQEQLRLLQRARDNGFDTAELDYFEALSIGPDARALPLLKSVVAADPASIRGGGHALLAETYYTLPDIAGGDLYRAIDMMRAAWERDPENPRYPRLLAGYLLDAARKDEALSALKLLLAMPVSAGGLQLMADQLRVAADLAQRIGDEGLAQNITARRAAMLTGHPSLQPRTVVSAMGHFGDKDPMQED